MVMGCMAKLIRKADLPVTEQKTTGTLVNSERSSYESSPEREQRVRTSWNTRLTGEADLATVGHDPM